MANFAPFVADDPLVVDPFVVDPLVVADPLVVGVPLTVMAKNIWYVGIDMNGKQE